MFADAPIEQQCDDGCPLSVGLFSNLGFTFYDLACCAHYNEQQVARCVTLTNFFPYPRLIVGSRVTIFFFFFLHWNAK